jgi:predicted Ser/Thr protein kinase
MESLVAASHHKMIILKLSYVLTITSEIKLYERTFLRPQIEDMILVYKILNFRRKESS